MDVSQVSKGLVKATLRVSNETLGGENRSKVASGDWSLPNQTRIFASLQKGGKRNMFETTHLVDICFTKRSSFVNSIHSIHGEWCIYLHLPWPSKIEYSGYIYKSHGYHGSYGYSTKTENQIKSPRGKGTSSSKPPFIDTVKFWGG